MDLGEILKKINRYARVGGRSASAAAINSRKIVPTKKSSAPLPSFLPACHRFSARERGKGAGTLSRKTRTNVGNSPATAAGAEEEEINFDRVDLYFFFLFSREEGFLGPVLGFPTLPPTHRDYFLLIKFACELHPNGVSGKEGWPQFSE